MGSDDLSSSVEYMDGWTNRLLQQISQGSPVNEIADTYVQALQSGMPVDWLSVNYCIYDRLGADTLTYIKHHAWTCADQKEAQR